MEGYELKTKRFLYLFSILFIVLGIVIEPSFTIITHLGQLIAGKDGLIIDYFLKGSVGASFLNAGLVGLASTIILDLVNSDFKGTDLGAVMLALAFSFFGKNIFTMWTFICGGVLYGKRNHIPLKDVMTTAIFSTSLSPLTSEILFVFELNIVVRIILFILTGIFIGYIINIVAPHTRKLHKGYNLYNVGIANGLVGTIFVSLFRSLGFEVSSNLLWDTNKHIELYIIFTVLFVAIGTYGYAKEKSFDNYKLLLKRSGQDCDFLSDYGLYTTLINFSITGLMSLLIIYVLDIPLNGAILGGVLTITGLSGAGKHPLNMAPIFVGALIASFINVWNITDPAVALTMLFLTGLSPVSGAFGALAGIIFTFVNISVALNTGILHGGLNLYNTGFSIALTSGVLIPLFERVFPKHKS